jgi:hypothetical protein
MACYTQCAYHPIGHLCLIPVRLEPRLDVHEQGDNEMVSSAPEHQGRSALASSALFVSLRLLHPRGLLRGPGRRKNERQAHVRAGKGEPAGGGNGDPPDALCGWGRGLPLRCGSPCLTFPFAWSHASMFMSKATTNWYLRHTNITVGPRGLPQRSSCLCGCSTFGDYSAVRAAATTNARPKSRQEKANQPVEATATHRMPFAVGAEDCLCGPGRRASPFRSPGTTPRCS